MGTIARAVNKDMDCKLQSLSPQISRCSFETMGALKFKLIIDLKSEQTPSAGE